MGAIVEFKTFNGAILLHFVAISFFFNESTSLVLYISL